MPKPLRLTFHPLLFLSLLIWVGICLGLPAGYTRNTLAILFLPILYLMEFRHPPSLSNRQMILGAMLLRCLLFIGPTILEDDWHRYLAEGYAITHGVPVYTLAPQNYLHSPEVPRILLKHQGFIHHTLHVGYAEFPAIYPPDLLFLFGFPGGKSGLFLWWVFLELALLYALRKQVHPAFFSLWLFSPLILWEGYLNRHYDWICGLLLLLAFLNPKKGWAALGFALHLKGLVFWLLPVFPWKPVFRGIGFFLVLEALCLWFYPDRYQASSSLKVFANFWEMNAPLITPLRIFLTPFFSDQAPIVARQLLLGIWVLLVLWIRRKRTMQPWEAMVAMCLCSPVNNPWYLMCGAGLFLYKSPHLRTWMGFQFLYYALWLHTDPIQGLFITAPLQALFHLAIIYTARNPQSESAHPPSPSHP